MDVLKKRGHELEEQIEDVTNSLNEISESKRNMEREKEIYDNQVNNLKLEEANLSKLETNKRSIQENLDKIRESEEQISRLEKYVSKLDVYLDFEKSVVSIQNLKEDEKQINDTLESMSQQKAIVAETKDDYNKFLASDEEISKLDNKKFNMKKNWLQWLNLNRIKKIF